MAPPGVLLRPSPGISSLQYRSTSGALRTPRGSLTQALPLPSRRHSLACPGEPRVSWPAGKELDSSQALPAPTPRSAHVLAASGELPRGFLPGSRRQGMATRAADVSVAAPSGSGSGETEALVGLGDSEEAEAERRFQEEWTSSPKRICIFVEPSPFE